jgi:hypothetical protein
MNPRTVRGAAAIAWHVGGRAVKRFVNSIGKRVHGARTMPVKQNLQSS